MNNDCMCQHASMAIFKFSTPNSLAVRVQYLRKAETSISGHDLSFHFSVLLLHSKPLLKYEVIALTCNYDNMILTTNAVVTL